MNPEREQEERRLMARIAAGDTASLEALYAGFRPRVHRFLARMGLDDAEFDEICNDVFYVVWRRARRYEPSARVSSWIFGIARNKALKSLERRKKSRERHSDMPLDELPEPKISDSARMELTQWLELALALLPNDQRMVVELTFMDGMSYREIANLMDCPENTVKTRMFHARRKLKEILPEMSSPAFART